MKEIEHARYLKEQLLIALEDLDNQCTFRLVSAMTKAYENAFREKSNRESSMNKIERKLKKLLIGLHEVKKDLGCSKISKEITLEEVVEKLNHLWIEIYLLPEDVSSLKLKKKLLKLQKVVADLN